MSLSTKGVWPEGVYCSRKCVHHRPKEPVRFEGTVGHQPPAVPFDPWRPSWGKRGDDQRAGGMEGGAEFRIPDALTVNQNNRGHLVRLTVDRPQVGGAHRSM